MALAVAGIQFFKIKNKSPGKLTSQSIVWHVIYLSTWSLIVEAGQ